MKSPDLAGLKVTEVIDARCSPCPGPLLETKAGIRNLKPGEVLEVLSHDPLAREDISAWAGKAGHEFLGFLGSQGYDRIF